MATDNTPPRLRLIVTIAIIVVITLIGLDFVFKSYYAFMTDDAKREKMAPLTEQTAQVAVEQAAFAGAKLPIDQAMAQLKAPRSELIEPKQSEDMGAMTGWSKLPKLAPGAGHDAGTLTVDTHALDGGAMTDDGGAAPTTTDAGAPTVIPHDAGATTHVADGGAAHPKPITHPGPRSDAGAHKPQP